MTKRKTTPKESPFKPYMAAATADVPQAKPPIHDQRYEVLAVALSSHRPMSEVFQIGEYLGLGKAPGSPPPAGGPPAVVIPQVQREREDEDDPELADFGDGASGEGGDNVHTPADPHASGTDGKPFAGNPWHEDRA